MFLNFLAITNGVMSKIGIAIAMNNVCNCVSAIVNAIPLAVPIKMDKKVPAHVGHAINKPVAAPTVLNPLPFLEIEKALTAIAVFSPTKYDTTTCRTRFTGIICRPTCSVIYTIIFGMYPGSSQHGATNPDGIVAP
jgi:hypothetical protein